MWLLKFQKSPCQLTLSILAEINFVPYVFDRPGETARVFPGIKQGIPHAALICSAFINWILLDLEKKPVARGIDYVFRGSHA